MYFCGWQLAIWDRSLFLLEVNKTPSFPYSPVGLQEAGVEAVQGTEGDGGGPVPIPVVVTGTGVLWDGEMTGWGGGVTGTGGVTEVGVVVIGAMVGVADPPLLGDVPADGGQDQDQGGN